MQTPVAVNVPEQPATLPLSRRQALRDDRGSTQALRT
jgi:hypothetical protein